MCQTRCSDFTLQFNPVDQDKDQTDQDLDLDQGQDQIQLCKIQFQTWLTLPRKVFVLVLVPGSSLGSGLDSDSS